MFKGGCVTSPSAAAQLWSGYSYELHASLSYALFEYACLANVVQIVQDSPWPSFSDKNRSREAASTPSGSRAIVISNIELVRQDARSSFSIAACNNWVPPPQPKTSLQYTYPNQTSMAASHQKFLTSSQDGNFGDREFVVACKGRPFTILTPASLPTPTVTYVDHKLVTELKLRISDLQCSRLHYGSKKLRILGKVSTSVQCINDGNVSGNLHMKALVVENLCEHFDVHSIAGIKLNQLLTNNPSLDLDTTDESDEPTRSPPKKKKKKKKDPPEIL